MTIDLTRRAAMAGAAAAILIPPAMGMGTRPVRAQGAARAMGLFLLLMKNIPDPDLRRLYRRRMTKILRRRPDPNFAFICVVKCAMHYHHHMMSREMVERRTPVNTI